MQIFFHLNFLSTSLDCIWHIKDRTVLNQVILKPRDEAIHLLYLTLKVERCICSEESQGEMK